MQSVYSWMGSRLHLVLEDDIAKAYNQAVDTLRKARVDHVKLHRREFNPFEDLISIKWTEEQRKAWNDIAQLINLLVEINGGALDVKEEEVTSDYLVKLG